MSSLQLRLVRQTVVNIRTSQVELREIRQAIDGVDTAIATLLASRVKLSRLAIATKAREGLPILDPIRELEIQRRYEGHALGAAGVARAILRWCRGSDER